MTDAWRDVNDVGFSVGKQKEKKPEPKPVDVDDGPQTIEKDEPEVKLSNGVFIEGPDGFNFNKKCSIQVNAKLLKETSRKKISFKTFVIFDGEEEDLGQPLEGFISDDGIAKADMMLFYGDKYSQAIGDDPEAKCYYKFKANHPKGTGEIESEELEMPYEASANSNEPGISPSAVSPDKEEKTIKLLLINENDEPYKGAAVEFSTGEVLESDENGKVELKLSNANEIEIEVVSIKLK